jgi:hypothetical protein
MHLPIYFSSFRAGRIILIFGVFNIEEIDLSLGDL